MIISSILDLFELLFISLWFEKMFIPALKL